MTKSKFWYLVYYGLKKRIATKAFIIANIIIAILLIGIINLPNIIQSFSSEAETTPYLVYDEVNAYEYLDTINDSQNLYEFTFEEATTPFNADLLPLDEYNVILRFYEKEGVNTCVMYYENQLSTLEGEVLKQIIASINQAMWFDTLTPLEQLEIQTGMLPMAIDEIYLGEETGTNDLMAALASIILMPIFFMLIMLMQFIGADILEEKSTKSIEYIISNVQPVKHFGSKILSVLFFMIIQGIIILGISSIGVLITTLTGGNILTTIQSPETGFDPALVGELVANIPMIIVVLGLFMLFGFTLYLVLIAIFSSMATNMEDYQQFITPVMLIILGGFYMGLFGSIFGESGFLKIVGYIPIFSPMIAPLLYISGAYSILEALISLLLLIILDGLIIYFGIPLYKVSILDYSQDKFFKKIMNIIKKSRYSK